MRVFLAGVIGAAASTAAWLYAEHVTQSSIGWMVILVGLVTGVSVLKASTGNSSGFLRGALAIVLTLTAIFAGRWTYARIMEADAKGTSAAVAVNLDADGVTDEEDSSEAADVATPAPIKLPEFDPNVELPAGYSNTAMKKNASEWDMIWMCIAALAAYITGKGGDRPAQTVVVEEPQVDYAHERGDEPEGSA